MEDEKSNILNAEQLAELRQAFKECDGNNDNFISTRELGWAMRVMGFNPTESELQLLVNKYDTDGSGKIEFPEFCNMMSHKMSYAEDEEMIRLAFRALDKDGSGTVSTKEFKHLMTHIGDPLTEEEASWLIKAADKNGDGCLDFEEFMKVMIGK